MSRYIIEGGHPLKGRIKASGNKNAALPCIAAALLTKEPVILRNIPVIEDVLVMLDICSTLGAKVDRLDEHSWKIESGNFKEYTVPAKKASKVRASILFTGPILARLGKVCLPPPGGDVIGRRRLDTHFLALEELGARVEINGTFKLSANKLKGSDIFLDEASVTATENAIMAAVLAEGSTIIQNAACEPHIQDLCNMLVSMGAFIDGIGSNVLHIEGTKELSGTDFSIGSDYMEIGSFIGLAAVTDSEIEIEGVNTNDLRIMKIAFGKLGISWKINDHVLKMSPGQSMKVVCDISGQIPKIDDHPWPGFPADLTSIMTVVSTQVNGTVLIHEKMFESRMFWVDKLIGMGARIVLCDPHRAVVSGPTKLHSDHLTSPDVRAGMALLIAALCANGVSEISNVYQIERGYENVVERLKALGAKIERAEDE